jgi:SAM-dependent methyltransferase
VSRIGVDDPLLTAVEQYYTAKVETHGPTPAGVDWNDEASQRLRFDQLLAVLPDDDRPVSILDMGCGYGALLEEIAHRRQSFSYCGYDISTAMIETARERCRTDRRARFTDSESELETVDYTLASGIFNVRLESGAESWRRYILDTVDGMAKLSRRGIAFNALTAHSDPDRMRSDLYYADPAELLDHCLRNHSRDVAIRHDYPLYEFTVLVRLDGRPPAQRSEATG